ncbi:MAG: hypothetical protein AAGI54_03835 [Planctomycetota bacterium]
MISRFSGGTAVIACAIVLFLQLATIAGSANAQGEPVADRSSTEPVPLDVRRLERLQVVRSRNALTSQHLAAIGLSEADATQALTTMREWIDNNYDALVAADQQAQQADAELQAAMRQINRGPKDDALLRRVPRLTEQQTAARAAVRDLEARAVEAVDLTLQPTQRQALATARRQRDLPGVLRYAGEISPADRQRLAETLERDPRALESASTRAMPSAVAREVDQARRNLKQYQAGVLAAELAVFGQPEDDIVIQE